MVVRRICLFAGLTAASLSGCTILPESGPSRGNIVDQAGSADNGAAGYDVVDITADVVNVLRRRAAPTLHSRFGDYRPPPDLRIGVGDFVSVTIWEAADNGLFTGSPSSLAGQPSTGARSATIPEQPVGRDGSITLPYAGRVRVAGELISEVEAQIEKRLEGKAVQPQVLLTVTKPVANTVTVMGEVSSGGRIPLSVRGDKLLDVVAAAGGTHSPVNATTVRLSRGGTTISVPLSRVVASPAENIYMRPGDNLTLVEDPQKFIALGATGRSDEVSFLSDRVFLSEALARVGGLDDNRSDSRGVFIFRYEPSDIVRAISPSYPVRGHEPTPVVYRLDLSTGAALVQARDFEIQNRDLVYVSDAPIVDLRKAIDVFQAITSPVGTGASVASVAR